MMMLLTSTLVFADDWKWDEKTRDAAYEAPNSKLQKKWYINDQYETTYQFGANGVVTLTQLVKNDHFDARIVITCTGKYTRNKDHLNLTWAGVQAKPYQADLDAMSARNRDNFLQSLKSFGHNFTSNYKNKTTYFLILRLDDECLIITTFNPQTKLFNDINWNTLFNESHKKKEKERAAQLAVEKARQDSIRQVQEAEAKARREAEEKARREAEEKAKREAAEKARLAEETRIKAENEYWARIGIEKKAAAEKAAAEGVKLVDLGLSVRWADRNIGASSPDDYGLKFTWGEPISSEYGKYKPAIKLQKGAVLDSNSDPAIVRWGNGFHVPTPEQWKELFEKCTIVQSKNGVHVTGPNGNFIFIPHKDNSKYVRCWTNTMSSENKKMALESCITLPSPQGNDSGKRILNYSINESESNILLPIRAVME